MPSFGDQIFFKSKYGFRKGSNSQHRFVAMLIKERRSNNKEFGSLTKHKTFGALRTDLPKGFSCLSHKLLIANLMPMISVILL